MNGEHHLPRSTEIWGRARHQAIPSKGKTLYSAIQKTTVVGQLLMSKTQIIAAADGGL